MSNDEVRWTRNNVDKTKTDNDVYIHNLKYCDSCLFNSSNNYKGYAITKWTTRRKKKKSSTAAIESCHQPFLSATRKYYRFLSVELVTIVFILNCSNFLTCATAAVIDSVDFSKGGYYTHTWAVHIPNGDEEADQVAQDHGFVNLGKVSVFHFIEYLSNNILYEAS